MKLTILSFVFIVLCHVSVAQTPITNNNIQSNNNCPLMEVTVNSNNNSDIIEVSYCNHGNVTAIGVYVEIEVTDDLLINQATIPVSSIVGTKYTFQLGDVNSLDCAAFYIEIPNVEDKIHCTNVQIFPDDPCQAMIDQYIINNTGSDDDGGDNDINTTAVTVSADMHHSIPGPPVLGQGGTNSVYEDHVFLNNIPTWDSLLAVLTNSGVLPNLVTNTSGTTNSAKGLDDITSLSSAKVCSDNGTGGGGTVIIRDIASQTTSIATDDRTIFGTTNTNNNQTVLNTVTTETVNEIQENKEVVVRLYPNPFSTTATITIDGANYEQTRIEVVDLAGKSIQSLQVNKQKSITLHRRDLNQGVYFYRLVGDDAIVHTGKFIIH